MAEGLEEESKKSLQMEAELEKQVYVYENDKKTLKAQLTSKELRYFIVAIIWLFGFIFIFITDAKN